MMSGKIYNFAAGPAVLPAAVLETAQKEMFDWHGSGMSVMEMSHRGREFGEIFAGTKEKFKKALLIPDTHEVLFMQGGATAQFASVPLNLMGERGVADYAVTGNFSGVAAEEAAGYGSVNIAATSADKNHSYIPRQEELKLTDGASYFHYCANNTIFGTAWDYVPETGSVPLVCDMSSEMLSHPVDVSKYALIYAGAQKNMAPAGLTMLIIDKSIAGRESPVTPKIMSYANMIEKDSMLNTPPCWCIYILGLVLDWLEGQGGVVAMAKLKKERSALIYDILDNSGLYKPHADGKSRSDMNVTFRTGDGDLDAEFLAGAKAAGLINIKGHRLTGGMRASLYNAMPMEGAAALAEYMKEFEVRHHV
ncbi:MAG: 3-phosphoserine/phosphohydroxythreonine transaminase [Clostridia bacterium]|nr:3-phosphoserine/phosphohydroxythreonine transaminase [Clostridia bacterium]